MAKKQTIPWEPGSGDAKQALNYWKKIPQTRRKVRAYFDEGIPMSVAERVRKKLGWDVEAVQENRKLRGRDDECHYQRARQDGRILFCTDKDFLDDRRLPLRKSPGTFVLTADQSSGEDIFYSISAVSIFLHDVMNRVPELPSGMKVLVTLEGQKIRFLKHDSTVVEIDAPWFP